MNSGERQLCRSKWQSSLNHLEQRLQSNALTRRVSLWKSSRTRGGVLLKAASVSNDLSVTGRQCLSVGQDKPGRSVGVHICGVLPKRARLAHSVGRFAPKT